MYANALAELRINNPTPGAENPMEKSRKYLPSIGIPA
jgi:hypothetical protein